MIKTYEIPKTLDLKNALDFTLSVNFFEESQEYLYDCTNMKTVEPFGMLVVSSKLRNFYLKNESSTHKVGGYTGKSYASHMGFFQSILIDHGKKPGEAPGSKSYLPLTKINIKESYSIALLEKSMDIEEYIDKEIATKLVSIVTTKNNEIFKILRFCISEIIRNVYHHSNSEDLWYAAQYWPSKDLVEIAILDEGKGIANTLKRNKNLIIEDDDDALRLSLKPGVTKSLIKSKNDDIYSNQGFGLFMTSKICEKAGDFSICSGDCCITIMENEVISRKSSLNGTAIRLRLKPSLISQVNIDCIREEGNYISDLISNQKNIKVESFED